MAAKADPEEVHEAMKSFLTVVADSAQVEVWSLDKAALQHAILENASSMGEVEIHSLYSKIVQCLDKDRGSYKDSDVNYIKHQFINWDRFKQEYIEKLQMEKFEQKILMK